MPDDLEAYIHRSGRTGRAGKSGISVSILHMRETGKLRHIEKLSNKRFDRKEVPGGEEICEVQLMHLADKVSQVEVNDSKIDPYMPAIMAKFEGLSTEEVLKRFVSAEFNRFLAYYKNAPDLNVRGQERKTVDKRGGRGSDRRNDYNDNGMSFSRLFINAGKKQNLNASRLLGLINEHSKRKNVEIGKIDIQRKFSFFEIDSRFEKELIQSMNESSLDGHSLEVDRVSGEERVSVPKIKKKKKAAMDQPRAKRKRTKR